MGHVAMASGPDGMLKCLDWGARGGHQKPQTAFIVFYSAGTGPIWAM